MSKNYQNCITEFRLDTAAGPISNRGDDIPDVGLRTGSESLAEGISTISTNSTNSTAGKTLETAIYPEESILSMMMDYGRQQSEAPDCYLLGSFLGVIAGCVARQIYYPWGRER